MLIYYNSIIPSINAINFLVNVILKKNFNFFFPFISCCTKTGDQPQEDLAKFRNPIPFWPTTKFYELNMKIL